MATQPKLNRTTRKAKILEFGKLIEDYSLGYRNREDVTKLLPGILIKGSQNVLTSVTGMVEITKGYTLDGQAGLDSGFYLLENGAFLLNEDGSFIVLNN